MSDGDALDEQLRSITEQLEDLGGVGEGVVIAPCTRCDEDVIVMWAGVGGDGIDHRTGEGDLGYKKGGGECPTCGLEATPVLSIWFGDELVS